MIEDDDGHLLRVVETDCQPQHGHSGCAEVCCRVAQFQSEQYQCQSKQHNTMPIPIPI